MKHKSAALPNCECPLQLNFTDPVAVGDEVEFANGWSGTVVFVVDVASSAIVKPRPAGVA